MGVKRSQKSKKTAQLKSLTVEEKEQLDEEGIVLLNRFAESMNTLLTEKETLQLVQEHYDWAKKFICKSKPTYMLYVNSLLYDKNTKTALSAKIEGLPEHMYSTIVKNISLVKQ